MQLTRLKNITVLSAALLTGSAAFAQSSDAILDLLIKKGVINQREANDVREQLDQQTQQSVDMYSKVKAGSWLDAFIFTGDLRARAEFFEFEHNPATKLALQGDRLRYRYRLRFGVEADYHDWATVNFRLGSGDDNPQASKGTGDPVSNNTTFTDTWRKKPVYIDAAYVTLRYPGCDIFKVVIGKMDLPIWQPKFNSPMVYDYDNTPEGAAEQVQFSFGDNKQFRLFAQAGQFALKEVSTDANDVYMFDQAAGFEWKVGDPKTPKLKLTGLGGLYFTENLRLLKAGDSPNKGNALIGANNTTNNVADFKVVYARAEAVIRLADKPFLGTPAQITVAGEYDINLANAFDKLNKSTAGVRSNDFNQTTGWTGQVAFGDAKKKGQWQVAYQYKHQEADSTWDAIADSDWGNGGTDRKGHVVKATYCAQDWWQLGFAAIITEKISVRPNSGHNTVGFAGEDQLRIQADTVFKF